MNILIDIERLSLDAGALSVADRAQLADALQRELTRLLGDGELGALRGGGLHMPQLAVEPVQLAGNRDPVELGRGLARSVHAGLRGLTVNANAEPTR